MSADVGRPSPDSSDSSDSSDSTAIESDASGTPPAAGTSSRRTALVVVATIVLILGLAAADLLLFRDYRNNSNDVKTAKQVDKQTVSTTYKAALDAAAKLVPQILTYSYTTIDADITADGAALTGSFKASYIGLLTTQVKPGATAQKISTKATQVGVSVINATDDTEVSVLVFLDQETTSATAKTPQISGSRVQIVMTRVGQEWLISGLTPVN